MEKYPSGSRGAPAKGVDRVTGARVRIPPSPPCRNMPKAVVSIKDMTVFGYLKTNDS